MKMNKILVILTSLLSLQSFAQNTQITSREQRIEQIKHDYEIWKIRHNAIEKTRNICSVVFLTTTIAACLTIKYLNHIHKISYHGAGFTYKIPTKLEHIISDNLLLFKSYLIPFNKFFGYTVLSSFVASLFSNNIVQNITNKLESSKLETHE